MSIEPRTPAKTLTQLVATEIRVQMARADVRQSQLAREIGKTEQWLSVRLRGRQPIDVNDLALIARGLGVGIHDLLPSPDDAREAADPLITTRYSMPALQAANKARPRDNRPTGQRAATAPAEGARTAYLTRPARGRRDR
jgi:transcriptional regulator with XRE-family HTH domain